MELTPVSTFCYFGQNYSSVLSRATIMFILNPATSITTEQFVLFWSALYDYRNRHVYDQIISKPSFEKNDIQRIYQWKNNVGKDQDKMSAGKQKFVDKVIGRLSLVNELKNNFSLSKYRDSFEDLSPVWGIFLLHLIQPEYPIYDQHVHRAYAHLTGTLTQMPSSKKQCYNLYYKNYVPFYQDLMSVVQLPPKTVDDALWAFGKFVSRYVKIAEMSKHLIFSEM